MSEPASSAAPEGPVVLIAEDDRDIRELVTRKLQTAGFRVIAVGDGLAALREARDNKPDIAVLDVMMPGLSGLQLTTALREDPVTEALPIILLTARSQEFDVEAGFSLSATDYIVKPFSPRQLVERIHAALATGIE
jgi:DNA-binding response OmpR family regulator